MLMSRSPGNQVLGCFRNVDEIEGLMDVLFGMCYFTLSWYNPLSM